MQAWMAIVLVFSALCLRAHSQPDNKDGQSQVPHGQEPAWHGDNEASADISGCCKAVTVECMACAVGVTVAEFCADRANKDVLGCKDGWEDGWPQVPRGQDAVGLGERDWHGDNEDGLSQPDWHGDNEAEHWSRDEYGNDKDNSARWSTDRHSGNDYEYWNRDGHNDDEDRSARWGRHSNGADKDEHWNRDGYGHEQDHSARAYRTRGSRGNDREDENSHTSARLRGANGGHGRTDENESEESEESKKKSKQVAWMWVAFALIAGLALGSACTAMCMLFQRVKHLESKLEAHAFTAAPAAWPTNSESASGATSSTREVTLGTPTVVRCSGIKEGKVVPM